MINFDVDGDGDDNGDDIVQIDDNAILQNSFYELIRKKRDETRKIPLLLDSQKELSATRRQKNARIVFEVGDRHVTNQAYVVLQIVPTTKILYLMILHVFTLSHFFTHKSKSIYYLFENYVLLTLSFPYNILLVLLPVRRARET